MYIYKTDKLIDLNKQDYEFISTLDWWDMTMLLSEINDHGWDKSKVTLSFMKKCGDKL